MYATPAVQADTPAQFPVGDWDGEELLDEEELVFDDVEDDGLDEGLDGLDEGLEELDEELDGAEPEPEHALTRWQFRIINICHHLC